jgi:hypothetical protein
MSTLAQITAAIDDDIRNKTPLVLKVEHADVEQLITDEMFPDSITVEWDGDSQPSGLPDVECNPLLATLAKCTFKIYFTKTGNRVFYKGSISNTETFAAIGNLSLATFDTTLYKPVTNFSSASVLIKTNFPTEISQNANITFDVFGINLNGTIPVGSLNTWRFEGSYKVAN